MHKQDTIVLFVLCLAMALIAQVASPPQLVFSGAVAILIALWWGRRPRAKVRVTHRRPASAFFELP